MKEKEEKKAFSMKLPIKFLDKVDHLAIDKHMTRTKLMKEALVAYLKKNGV